MVYILSQSPSSDVSSISLCSQLNGSCFSHCALVVIDLVNSYQWALIELCRKPEKQQRLRDELLQAGSSDPTYDQLWSGLPYLDAVAHEVLRLHPPVGQTTRVVRAFDPIICIGTPKEYYRQLRTT